MEGKSLGLVRNQVFRGGGIHDQLFLGFYTWRTRRGTWWHTRPSSDIRWLLEIALKSADALMKHCEKK